MKEMLTSKFYFFGKSGCLSQLLYLLSFRLVVDGYRQSLLYALRW